MDIQQFLFPAGTVSLNDIVTSMGTGIVAIVMWRQKEKDRQIENRDKDIKDLKEEIQALKEELDRCYEKRMALIDKLE
jgi:prefoldin subunit 5